MVKVTPPPGKTRLRILNLMKFLPKVFQEKIEPVAQRVNGSTPCYSSFIMFIVL